MFANLVDLSFEEVLATIKENLNNYLEAEDSEYYQYYNIGVNIINKPFNSYKRKMYFARKEWPDCVYIRLDIARSENDLYEHPDSDIDVSELFGDQSVKKIIEKIDNDKLSFCLKHVFCKIINDRLYEDHSIMIYHPTYSDLFAEDWCCYYCDYN